MGAGNGQCDRNSRISLATVSRFLNQHPILVKYGTCPYTVDIDDVAGRSREADQSEAFALFVFVL